MSYVLLFLAALAAGAINSVAGGGSFIAFPALLFAGVPPIAANATNTVALWPGSVASAIAYRAHLPRDLRQIAVLSGASLAGGATGAVLLLRTSAPAFLRLVPWLLLIASVLLTAGPAIGARVHRDARSRRATLLVALLQVAIGVYGGYFGAGIGILMLASISLLGLVDVHSMNALKTVLASVINGAAVLFFVGSRAVVWAPGAVMIVGGVLGGYAGAWLARRVEGRLVRRIMLAVAWTMTAWFFARGRLQTSKQASGSVGVISPRAASGTTASRPAS